MSIVAEVEYRLYSIAGNGEYKKLPLADSVAVTYTATAPKAGTYLDTSFLVQEGEKWVNFYTFEVLISESGKNTINYSVNDALTRAGLDKADDDVTWRVIVEERYGPRNKKPGEENKEWYIKELWNKANEIFIRASFIAPEVFNTRDGVNIKDQNNNIVPFMLKEMSIRFNENTSYSKIEIMSKLITTNGERSFVPTYQDRITELNRTIIRNISFKAIDAIPVNTKVKLVLTIFDSCGIIFKQWEVFFTLLADLPLDQSSIFTCSESKFYPISLNQAGTLTFSLNTKQSINITDLRSSYGINSIALVFSKNKEDIVSGKIFEWDTITQANDGVVPGAIITTDSIKFNVEKKGLFPLKELGFDDKVDEIAQCYVAIQIKTAASDYLSSWLECDLHFIPEIELLTFPLNNIKCIDRVAEKTFAFSSHLMAQGWKLRFTYTILTNFSIQRPNDLTYNVLYYTLSDNIGDGIDILESVSYARDENESDLDNRRYQYKITTTTGPTPAIIQKSYHDSYPASLWQVSIQRGARTLALTQFILSTYTNYRPVITVLDTQFKYTGSGSAIDTHIVYDEYEIIHKFQVEDDGMMIFNNLGVLNYGLRVGDISGLQGQDNPTIKKDDNEVTVSTRFRINREKGPDSKNPYPNIRNIGTKIPFVLTIQNLAKEASILNTKSVCFGVSSLYIYDFIYSTEYPTIGYRRHQLYINNNNQTTSSSAAVVLNVNQGMFSNEYDSIISFNNNLLISGDELFNQNIDIKVSVNYGQIMFAFKMHAFIFDILRGLIVWGEYNEKENTIKILKYWRASENNGVSFIPWREPWEFKWTGATETDLSDKFSNQEASPGFNDGFKGGFDKWQ